MIRSKLPLRRPLAILGATFLGLTATLALATPASAHHPIVSGAAVCVTPDGDWKVAWTVGNSEGDIPATITWLDPTPGSSPVTGFDKGSEVPAGGEVTGEQLVPSSNKQASLKVRLRWIREHDGRRELIAQGSERIIVRRPAALTQCVDPTPTPTPSPDPSTEPTPEPEPTPDPDPSTNPTPEPAEPAEIVTFTCDELTFTINNPKSGESITVTYTPSKGEAQTLTVAPGESKSVTFPASEGLTVNRTAEGYEDAEPITWEQPKGCGGGGGGLPVTGAAAAGIAGGAVVLLAIGVTLFLVARRRRLTFTA